MNFWMKLFLSTGLGTLGGFGYSLWAQTLKSGCVNCHQPSVPIVAGALVGLIAALTGKSQ